MRKSTLVVLVAALVGLTAATARAGTTFTVTNTNDSGAGSLRQAILDANAGPGKDTIAFALPGPGVIFPATELPVVTDPIVIDGTTQPGYTGTPLVVLFGGIDPSAGSLAYGLDIQAGQSTVSALAIGGFGVGIKIERASNDTVVRSTIGTNPSGTSALPNTDGIEILGGSENTIGGSSLGAGNVISGNTTAGIAVEVGNGDVIEGNTIGATADGLRPLPNGIGVAIDGGSTGTRIGDAKPPAGNVISGNTGDGVQVRSDFDAPLFGGQPTGTVVQGNRIGTRQDGSQALANGNDGIHLLGAAKSLIGGPLAGDGNLVSGNASRGIEMENVPGVYVVTPPSDNLVAGNLIGTSADGESSMPNNGGVSMIGGVGNLIGSLHAPHLKRGAGNVISGNKSFGVEGDFGSGNAITGNLIGRAKDGTTPLGNTGYGIYLFDETGTTIGSPSDPNVIADNGSGGVVLQDSDSEQDTISANSIVDNGRIGIDLTGDLVTLNDPGDADTGVNGLQNFPVLTSVSRQGGQIVVTGTLNSRPFGTYRLEFFANSNCDPSGYGQGESYLGTKTVVTDSFGNVTFAAKFPLKPSSATPIVTATATDVSGNTSEFSACSSPG